MKNFTFYNPTRILFGDGQLARLTEEIRRHGQRVLMVYGSGSIQKSGLYDEVVSLMHQDGCEMWELGGIRANPVLTPVYEGIRLVKEHDIQLVLAVGGGSVIDTAKAIAAGAMITDDVWSLFDHTRVAKEALPVGVVLTIPAAGSESSNSAVITKEEGCLKYSFSAECIIPAFAILEPKRTCSLSPYQTACGIADMLCHVLERYLCEDGQDALMDGLCESAMRTIMEQAPKVLANPNDLQARAQLMWAGTLAHNNLFGSGRRQDWSAHGIEHELSALYNIAHGAGMAIMMPAWMTYCAQTLQGALVRLATRVFCLPDHLPADQLAQEGIKQLQAFFSSIGLAHRLSDLQIDGSRFAEMGYRCAGDGVIGGVYKLSARDVEQIFELAL
ncbi:MAG: iron-containing alcohol dehydrogenase [Clostridiales bacterium]|nr:iron-containing alcohol dehydrogenase [Clostridiales bacterium]